MNGMVNHHKENVVLESLNCVMFKIYKYKRYFCDIHRYTYKYKLIWLDSKLSVIMLCAKKTNKDENVIYPISILYLKLEKPSFKSDDSFF